MKSLLFALIIMLLISITNQATADDKPLTGQAKLDSLLAELPKAKGDTNEVKLLSHISFSYIRINPELGIKYGLRGLDLANSIKWKKGAGICYNTLGLVNHYGKSNYIKALEYFQKALVINESITNLSGIATNLKNIGALYYSQSNYPKSMEYFQKVLAIHKELDNLLAISEDLNNIAGIYTIQSDYLRALDYFKNALKINEEIGNKRLIAKILHNIGATYVKLLNSTKAIDYFQKSIIINENMGNKSSVAYTINDIGHIYLSQSNFPKALEYFQKALTIYKQIEDRWGIATSLNNIGLLYLDLSQDSLISSLQSSTTNIGLNKEMNLNISIDCFLQVISIFRDLNLIVSLSDSYNNLHKAYYQKGMFKESIDAHRQFKDLQDSVFNQEKSKQLAALEKAREDDVNRIQIEKQQVQLTAQESEKMFIIYSGIGIVAFVVAILILIAYQRKKSDKLLYNVLPISIAKRLKKKEHPISDYFVQASIIFIDIVGFTAMSKDSDPTDIVKALNKIFTHYDSIASKHGLEKIKTIGDSYMAAAGIPEIQKDNTHRAAQMALEVKAMMKDYHTADGTKIEVRIGLDCGPVVAGVIGENKFIYDMWSDAVNTASRMESSSIAGQVHVSERFKEAVTEFEQFNYVERGEIDIKGKGKMKTYFIEERKVEVV